MRALRQLQGSDEAALSLSLINENVPGRRGGALLLPLSHAACPLSAILGWSEVCVGVGFLCAAPHRSEAVWSP